MATYHPKKKLYEARRRYKDEAGKPCRESFWEPTAEAAERAADEWIASRKADHDGSLESFGAFVYAPTIVHKSYKWREQVVWATTKWIYPAFGPMKLTEITRPKVQAFFNRLVSGKKIGRSSIGHIRKVFSAIMTLAEEDGLIDKHPVRKIALPPAQEAPVTIWSMDELALMVICSEGTVWQLPIFLGGMFGLRLGEALGPSLNELTPDVLSVDFQVQKLRKTLVRSGTLKTPGSHRDIPLPVGAYARILAMKQGEGDHLCPCLKGTFLDPENASRALADAIERANKILEKPMPLGSFHDLRHSFASIMDDLGCPAPAKRELMGHVGKTVSDRYSRAFWDTKLKFLGMLMDAIDRNERLLRPGRKTGRTRIFERVEEEPK